MFTPFLFVFAASGEITVEQNGGPPLLSFAEAPDGTSGLTDKGDGEEQKEQEEKHEEENKEEQKQEEVDAPVINEIAEKPVEQEEVKKTKSAKSSRFGKLFKIKPHVKKVPKEESSGESQSPPEAEPQQVRASDFCLFSQISQAQTDDFGSSPPQIEHG